MPDPSTAQPPAEPTCSCPVRDDLAYFLPLGVFLLFIFLGDYIGHALGQVLRAVIVPVILWWLWRCYTTIKWTHTGLAVLVGIVGIIQWIGVEKLLLSWSNAMPPGQQANLIARSIAGFLHWYTQPGKPPFDPYASFSAPWMLYGYIGIRWAAAALMVPVMEELFWRDFLWREMIAPRDFKLAKIGEWDTKACIVMVLACASVHPQWITAIIWSCLMAWLLVRTKSIGACIIAHGVTNFLLGAYVLWTHDWIFW